MLDKGDLFFAVLPRVAPNKFVIHLGIVASIGVAYIHEYDGSKENKRGCAYATEWCFETEQEARDHIAELLLGEQEPEVYSDYDDMDPAAEADLIRERMESYAARLTKQIDPEGTGDVFYTYDAFEPNG